MSATPSRPYHVSTDIYIYPIYIVVALSLAVLGETIMDRITESLLDEFSREHDISGLPQDKRFEHFASYVTVRRQYSQTFETEEIVTGAGGDIGIDAIAIIINGNLVTDHDSLTEMITDSDHLDVMFIFVQASRSMGFEAAKIGSFSWCAGFFQQPATAPAK